MTRKSSHNSQAASEWAVYRNSCIGVFIVLILLISIEFWEYRLVRHAYLSHDLSELSQLGMPTIEIIEYLVLIIAFFIGGIMFFMASLLQLGPSKNKKLTCCFVSLGVLSLVSLWPANAAGTFQNRLQRRIDLQYQAALVTKSVTAQQYTQIDDTTFDVNNCQYRVADSKDVTTNYSGIPQAQRRIKITWQEPAKSMNYNIRTLASDSVKVPHSFIDNQTVRVEINQ